MKYPTVAKAYATFVKKGNMKGKKFTLDNVPDFLKEDVVNMLKMMENAEKSKAL